MAKSVYQQLQERNARETFPFIDVHESHATLLNQVDALQSKNEAAEREIATLRQHLKDAALGCNVSKTSSAAATAALKIEAKLRNKLEKLQDEYNAVLKSQTGDQAAALKTAKDLGSAKDLNTAQEFTITNLTEENKRAERMIVHLTNQVTDAKSRTELAEQQYDGLKTTIRSLQEENDELRKENRLLEQRVVNEKSGLVDEMNILTDMVDALKKEVDMLRSYKKTWWGNNNNGKAPSAADNADGATSRRVEKTSEGSSSRKFGVLGVVVPTAPKLTIQHAHSADGTCVRYDASGVDLLVTAGSDALVKVWDTNSGQLKATLRGTNQGHAILGCDLSGTIVVGAGSDKTCRVWNLKSERMVHQLVGHAHKVTCVRLFGSDKAVLTGSADRSLKVWDISSKTYKQTTTMRHGSTAHCIDVGMDSVTAVSGHMDGGLRFWDLRTGDRTADLANLHESGITSVHINPADHTQVLTNGLDSCLRLIDIRTELPLYRLQHADLMTSHVWSRACWSPDGRFVAAGSSSNGNVYIYQTSDGSLHSVIQGGHAEGAGVCAIDWSRGGTNGQQVATLDRRGSLVLWLKKGIALATNDFDLLQFHTDCKYSFFPTTRIA